MFGQLLATGARRVLRRDLDTADEAIATIEETSRATLRELRRLLDVLRTDAEPAADLARSPAWPASRRWSSRCGRRACR
ncbi:histidine kinase [Micromonospora sp. ATA51]|uniref:histidine kinase n=1 Tax=Micromonospora sp. ATA51 TaxID=2806098 RepID=UPI001EE407AC|nr:histidine kinase [Micromonospora sp. ATA51]